MVGHNNVIPNGHFHKNWKKYIKTWFNQPMRKQRRRHIRARKAASVFPKPVAHLKPIVHCPTTRYNTKIRIGRGFSLLELKEAKLNKKFAKSIGISVDYRKFNKSVAGLTANVRRLKEYVHNIIILPKNNKKQPDVIQRYLFKRKDVNKIPQLKKKVIVRVPTEEEKTFSAYQLLRKCRLEQKVNRAQLKRMKINKILA